MKKLCRILFSRYAISAAVIFLDITVITLLVINSARAYVWFAAASLIIGLAVILSLINRDTNPEFKVTWLVIVLTLPFFGALLYILFYSRRLSKKDTLRIRRVTEAITTYEAENNFGTERAGALEELAERDRSWAGRALSLLSDDPISSVYSDGDCKYFDSGEELYSDMLRSIENAEKYIFLEYFIIAEGEMWQGIYDRLLVKAREGVDVRILYDDIGSMSRLPRDFDTRLGKCGIKCYRFAKVTPRVTSVHNNRDHRKLLIVDGKIAYTGGVNIADEYINRVKRFGHWKDGGIRLRGSAVLGFVKLFLSLYDFTSGNISDYSYFLCQDKKNEVSFSDGGFYIPFGTGPAPVYGCPVGKRALMSAINRAERYLYITTPYLIVDYDLTEALRSAASRGVDVRIITPGIADKKIVKIMTKGSYSGLISSGVRIFEYTEGFIHEKLLVCDGSMSIIGTINLDYRSLVHHFECALFVYGSPEIENIREGFMSTLRKCREIDGKSARLGPIEIIIRYLVRLFAPLL